MRANGSPADETLLLRAFTGIYQFVCRGFPACLSQCMALGGSPQPQPAGSAPPTAEGTVQAAVQAIATAGPGRAATVSTQTNEIDSDRGTPAATPEREPDRPSCSRGRNPESRLASYVNPELIIASRTRGGDSI